MSPPARLRRAARLKLVRDHLQRWQQTAHFCPERQRNKLAPGLVCALDHEPEKTEYASKASEPKQPVSTPTPAGIAYDNASYSLGLGALRGFAALGVVIFHVFLFIPIGGIELPHEEDLTFSSTTLLAQHLFLGLLNGRALVTMFFVLSGCVLGLSLDR